MELIKEIERKRSKSRKSRPKGALEKWGVFFCPHCKKEAEKRTHQGKRDKSCGCMFTIFMSEETKQLLNKIKYCRLCNRQLIKRKNEYPSRFVKRKNCNRICAGQGKNVGKLHPMYGKNHTKETKRKMSIAQKGKQKTEKHLRNIIKGQLKANNRTKPNKPELKLNNILQQLFPNEYKLNVKADIIIAGKIPDFININGQKKIIELYGDYWHKNTQAKDLKRQKLIESLGYKTLIVWEHKLKNIHTLNNKLKEFHK